MSTPCHTLPINDMLLFDFYEKFYLISCSEDGLLKIWN